MHQFVVTVTRDNHGRISCDPPRVEAHRGDTIVWRSEDHGLSVVFDDSPFADHKGSTIQTFTAANGGTTAPAVVRADAPLNKVFQPLIAVAGSAATHAVGDVIVR